MVCKGQTGGITPEPRDSTTCAFTGKKIAKEPDTRSVKQKDVWEAWDLNQEDLADVFGDNKDVPSYADDVKSGAKKIEEKAAKTAANVTGNFVKSAINNAVNWGVTQLKNISSNVFKRIVGQ